MSIDHSGLRTREPSRCSGESRLSGEETFVRLFKPLLDAAELEFYGTERFITYANIEFHHDRIL